MKLQLFLLITQIYVLCVCGAPQDDLIKYLPGQEKFEVNFKQYSGYLKATDGVQLHYWFVESARNKTTDPLVLWLNGGPGCSSLEGLLNELGPFFILDDGKTFIQNDYSWSNIANLLVIESPACVGFSFNGTGDCVNGDSSTALNNYVALLDFFRKFPEYKDNDFYVTGESYGGIYVPTLSLHVVQGMKQFPINFKGYAVGNGLGSYALNDDSIIFFGYYHGLIGSRLWNTLVDHCCKNGRADRNSCSFSSNPYPSCTKAVKDANNMIYGTGLNIYNMYDDCAPVLDKVHITMKNIFHKNKEVQQNIDNLFSNLNAKPTQDMPSCITGSGMVEYLNRKDVQKLLHVRPTKWGVCNMDVNINYRREVVDTSSIHKELVKHVRALIYNGDVDMACNFLGDEWMVDDLGLTVLEKRQPWHFNGKYGQEMGGFYKKFENLIYTTVRGAGHMVPKDKPKAAFQMYKCFLLKDSSCA